jgi:hypothetical protein
MECARRGAKVTRCCTQQKPGKRLSLCGLSLGQGGAGYTNRTAVCCVIPEYIQFYPQGR